MRKVTKVATLIMASMLVLGSQAAFAVDKAGATDGWCHGDGAMMNKKDGRDHHNMFDGVNLTEQQRQQMRDLMRQSRKTNHGLISPTAKPCTS